MLGDLNIILDGLTELEEKGVETIDCRRAQFSAQEPIIRLRMICQSWKVMFQAEYSSGSPLRMLVDLRASVDHALGRGKATADGEKPKPAAAAKPAVAAKPADGGNETAAVAAKPRSRGQGSRCLGQCSGECREACGQVRGTASRQAAEPAAAPS